jgi:hypothetical protein
VKELSPVWFIQEPIDLEHKQYVLLDFISSLTQDIKEKRAYSVIKKIEEFEDDLIFYRKYGPDNYFISKLTEEELEYLFEVIEDREFEKEREEIEKILSWGIEVLEDVRVKVFKIVKKIEGKIRILDFQNPFSKRSGVVVFVSKENGDIHPYWWKASPVVVGDRSSRGVIVKKIVYDENKKGEMDYQTLLEDLLKTIEIGNPDDQRTTVVEIDMTFSTSDDVFKIAKEKFLKVVD